MAAMPIHDEHLKRIVVAIIDAVEAGAFDDDPFPISIASAAGNTKTGEILRFTVSITKGWDSHDKLVSAFETKAN